MLNTTDILSPWSLPQPVILLGFSLLVASAAITGWIDLSVLVPVLLFVPIPLLWLAEYLMPKRKDWLLDWKDFTEDLFWVACSFLIWGPIYDDAYDTPISNLFTLLRDNSGFGFRLEADTTGGLLVAAFIAIFAAEFIGYWAHRVQHRFMFLWRIHATHHHITKMSVARAERTHPLEFLGLNLGSAVALAFLGASAEVVAVVVVFRLNTAHLCHSNLPLVSGAWGWLFNTPEWHQLHHSCIYKESNTNFGCAVIIWDRLFGTFSGKNYIEQVGNGSGEKLSIVTQLLIPFKSDKALREL
ncbi:MAG: sterol desaturase family protein [Proteobacteria bacterium]|nr:sterol desaturase family protein [Pseudomonadota bacterium]MDA1289586.1 sterol desaturase family protein [Pseudomonadota bacterium]